MKGIVIAHLNVCSLVNKIDSIRYVLGRSGTDILFISESWLHEGILNNEIGVPGYYLLRSDRKSSR